MTTGSSILSSAFHNSFQGDENLQAQSLDNEFDGEKDGVQKDLEALRMREGCFIAADGADNM